MDGEEGNATLSGKEDLTDDAMDNMQRMERIQAMTDWGMQTSTSKENISGRVTKTREREQELRCCGRKYGRKSTSHFFESWLWWFYYTSGSRVAFLFFSRFVSSALSYFHPPHPRVSPYLFPSLEQQALATRRSVAWCEPSTRRRYSRPRPSPAAAPSDASASASPRPPAAFGRWPPARLRCAPTARGSWRPGGR